MEHVVAEQIVQHLQDHAISKPIQSAYRKCHSTETALTFVANDILNSLDKRNSVFLVLLDLSAAFDTVDHQLLLSRLKNRVRLGGQVLDWVVSYLSSRYQCVSVARSSSEPKPLACGVPQGSVLGPIFFTIHTLPLLDIALKYKLFFHLYADDTQLYLSFDCNDSTNTNAVLHTLEGVFLK